jgi:hypothetical protein
MTTPQLPEQRRTDSENKVRTARLFVLDIAVGRILSLNPDGSDKQVIVTDCPKPDGIAVDKQMGHIYWTNMGEFKQDDGSIERVELDGKNRTTIVPKGETFTPKQLALDRKNRKLYWSDREGMRVMRCNLDGSQIQTLVDTSKGDPRPGPDAKKWCVGIAADADRGQMYWTQKGPDNAGVGRIFRANIEVPKGETPANRSDIEVLYDGLPEPIDLELDLKNRLIYWTDRGEDTVALWIASGMVVAMAQGCSELGPRALGNRSVLASAHVRGMRKRVSEELKGREWYRPMGGVIALEAFDELFGGQHESPYMLFNYDLPEIEGPEARHVDGSSRLRICLASVLRPNGPGKLNPGFTPGLPWLKPG